LQCKPKTNDLVCDTIPSSRTLVEFTTGEDADVHCELKALGLRSQRIFDWLDQTLGYSRNWPLMRMPLGGPDT